MSFSLFFLCCIVLTLIKSVFFVNYLRFFFYKYKIIFNYFIFMSDNLFEIDSAMNMIKEDIIRELSESVSKQNNESYLQEVSSNSISFSEKIMD